MQGRAILIVSLIDSDAQFLEESETVGLVTLRGDMHHVDTHLVSGFWVCSVLDKQLQELDVAMVARVVQGVEALIGL